MSETGEPLSRDEKLAPMRAELDRQSRQFAQQQAAQVKQPVSAESPPLARPLKGQPVEPGKSLLDDAGELGLLNKDIAHSKRPELPPHPKLPELPKKT